jgi:hypothetical protein
MTRFPHRPDPPSRRGGLCREAGAGFRGGAAAPPGAGLGRASPTIRADVAKALSEAVDPLQRVDESSRPGRFWLARAYLLAANRRDRGAPSEPGRSRHRRPIRRVLGS